MARRPGLAVLGALLTSAGLVLVWVLAFHVGWARHLDGSILAGFLDLGGRGIHRVAKAVASVCDPKPFVVWAILVTLVAVRRRRPRTAVAVAAVLVGANLTTQLLKTALAQHRYSDLLAPWDQIGPVSWPSGHATASMSLALCAVMVASSRWRPLVAAVGGLFVVAVVFSFLVLDWHYPSDVLGGFLVATTWTLLAVAGLWWADQRVPQRPAATTPPRMAEALAPAGVAALAGVAVVVVVLLARPGQVIDYVSAHAVFVIGAAAIGALALALASGLALMLRIPRVPPPRQR